MKLFSVFGLGRSSLAGLTLCTSDVASETLVEAVDTASRIHAMLLTRPERMGISRNFQRNYAIFNTIDSLLFGGRLRGAGDVFFTRIRIDEFSPFWQD